MRFGRPCRASDHPQAQPDGSADRRSLSASSRVQPAPLPRASRPGKVQEVSRRPDTSCIRATWPVSRVLSGGCPPRRPFIWGWDCSRPLATNPGGGLDHAWSQEVFSAPVPPLFGLAPGGVCRAVSVAGDAVRSYRTLSPLPLRGEPRAGGLLSVALSLGSPPAAVSRHRRSLEPGLSSTGRIWPRSLLARQRPSGQLAKAIRGCRGVRSRVHPVAAAYLSSLGRFRATPSEPWPRRDWANVAAEGATPRPVSAAHRLAATLEDETAQHHRCRPDSPPPLWAMAFTQVCREQGMIALPSNHDQPILFECHPCLRTPVTNVPVQTPTRGRGTPLALAVRAEARHMRRGW